MHERAILQNIAPLPVPSAKDDTGARRSSKKKKGVRTMVQTTDFKAQSIEIQTDIGAGGKYDFWLHKLFLGRLDLVIPKMFGENDTLESLKLRLKSVTKQKLSQESEVLKLRNKERSLMDELNTTKAEVEHLSEHLELLKIQITQSKHQISMIDMCMASEDLKVESHINILNEHLGGFQRLFDRDRRELEQRIKEQREKEAKLQEDMRQKEKQIAEENQRQIREAAAIEEESKVLERECAVLKKRNHAIMLKLRKRLLEAENTRREVMKRKASQISTNNENETN